MDIQEYIDKRLEPQRKWYEEKATFNKKRFMLFQKIVIIIGAIIPIEVAILTFFDGKGLSLSQYSGPLSAVLSAIIAVVAGFDKLQNPQANWFNYRANEEMLKKEIYLFKFRIGPYEGLEDEESDKLLVERTENLISADIARFTASQKHKEKSNKKKDKAPFKNQDEEKDENVG